MSKVTLGLSAILGCATELNAANKAFQTEGYTRFGLTYQDTANMNQEDGESTEFFAEEEDDAIDEITKQVTTTFNFSIMDPDLDTIARLFGGEVASNVYAYPDAVAQKEESVMIIPKKGLCFHVTRGRLKAKFNGDFSKKGLLLLEVSVKVMKPNTSGVKKIYIKKLTAQEIEDTFASFGK